MGILYAVVIAHYMLNRIHDETKEFTSFGHCTFVLQRIRVKTQEFIREYHSDPAMYSTLLAPAVVISHCILHRIRVETQDFNHQYQSDPAM